MKEGKKNIYLYPPSPSRVKKIKKKKIKVHPLPPNNE
jgi:hypothetical protein